MNSVKSQRRPGILFLNMGEGTTMPDMSPVIDGLKAAGQVNVYEASANPLLGNSVLTRLSNNGGNGGEFSRSDIDVIDLSGLRQALTLHNENGDLVYPYILKSIKQIIALEEKRGHEVKVIPSFEQIDFLLSKPTYFKKLLEQGSQLIPTEFLSSDNGDRLSDSISRAMNMIKEDDRGTGKFIIKPGTAAMAYGLVQLINPGKPGGHVLIPQLGTDVNVVDIETEEALEEYLKKYLTETKSYKHEFMLQPYIPNIEISQVNIGGNHTYILRIQGPSGIAHGNFSGLDLILNEDKTPDEIRSFIQDTAVSKLPPTMRDPYFLRADIMIDLRNDEIGDDMDTFFRMDGDSSNGFLQLVRTRTGFNLADPLILAAISDDANARDKVTACIMDWLRQNDFLTPERMVIAEFEGAGGTRLWRSESAWALNSYNNMLVYRGLPPGSRPVANGGSMHSTAAITRNDVPPKLKFEM